MTAATASAADRIRAAERRLVEAQQTAVSAAARYARTVAIAEQDLAALRLALMDGGGA